MLCTIVSDDMETIDFEKKIRPEQKNTKGRVIQNERTYFDFLISGQSAKTILRADNFDLISPFGWGDEKYENETIKEYTGLKRPEIPSGRLMIYVCPECADIGCGSITADIEITDDKVIWKNFGYENNDPDIDLEPYKDIGPIEFRKADYLERFQNIKRS
jgi:hypothetical protein